jgi:signal transduction histidine kinase
MKIDLVTNVSHDLKTPLTSIISYIDLLSREELTTEAADYVKILEKKSDRLKKIVSDLFDLAKSTSGSDELELEKLDCAVLLKQVMADMEDAITSSGRTIRCEYGSDPAPVYADGKKMYRIFQNILDNALKYSMDGTRIFLEMKVSGSKVVTSIKNTANYEMDFDTEEILGRFTRGEKSRTGEGNGLGLSIAKSFADACGGDLAVGIDGDQFNVTLTFPVTKS